MIHTLKQDSLRHRDWQVIRDKIIGNIAYNFKRTRDGYIKVSFDENITSTNQDPSHVYQGKTTGTLVDGSTMVDALGAATTLKLLNAMLDDTNQCRHIEHGTDKDYIHEMFMTFGWYTFKEKHQIECLALKMDLKKAIQERNANG